MFRLYGFFDGVGLNDLFFGRIFFGVIFFIRDLRYRSKRDVGWVVG